MNNSNKSDNEIDYTEYWEERVRTDNVKKKPRHFEIVKIITESKKQGKILDLGCGEGHILNSIPQEFEVYGADITSRPSEFLDKRITFTQCDISNSFPYDMKFDVIVCSEVIEHINKPDFLLKNINVHLKPDGMAILSIPNFKNTNEKGGDPTHIHGWRVSEFKKLLSDNGFKVINHYPTLFNIGKFNITKRKREILFSVFKRVPIKFMMNLMGEQIIFVCVKSE